MQTPQTVAAGKPVTVKVRHRLPENLGEQLVHVTLKGGPQGKRIVRKVVKAAGHGVLEVTFDVPGTVTGNVVRFAAFVGKDYDSSLQHLQSKSVPVR